MTRFSVQEMWNTYITKNPQYGQKTMPISYYFCDNEYDANICANLVLTGDKCATAPSLWWFEKQKEPLPKIGDLEIVTNWNGDAMGIVRLTNIVHRPYKEIDANFAFAEGEGDKSLAYWKRVHKAYYTREMAPYGDSFSEDMIVVCIYFELIFSKNEMT